MYRKLVRCGIFLFTNGLQIFYKQSEESTASLLKREDLKGTHSRWLKLLFFVGSYRNLSILENNERTH